MENYHNFEDILRDVGSLGVYQWFIWALMQYSIILQTVNQNFMAFGKIPPPWRCGQLGTDDDNNITVRFENDSKSKPLTCPNYTVCEVMDEEMDFYSLVRDWNLYCELSYVPMFIVSIQMLGIIPGAFVFTHLVDNYGRRWSCHLLQLGVVILGLSSAFAENWQIFAAIRFLIGFLFGGFFLVTVVTQMEIIKENDRMWMYALDFWSVSNGILSFIAYLTGTWRKLIIVSNCICIPLLFLYFLAKESPRWLLQKGRFHEAASVLNHMARWNGKKIIIDSDTLKDLVQYRRRHSISSAKGDADGQEMKKSKKKRQYSMLDIFHSRTSIINFFTLAYGWLATACISHGLVYQNTAYTGSPFVNYAIAAALRVVTQVILFVSDKYLQIRRRVLYLTSVGLVVSMLTVMAIIVIVSDPANNHTDATILRVVGLVCSGLMSALWLIIYLLPVEIFPTVIRNIAMGGCSIMARIGAILGPQLIYMQNFWAPTPFVGFTIVTAINFLSAFFLLPETRGTTLPDSLDDSPKKADGAEQEIFLKNQDGQEMNPLK